MDPGIILLLTTLKIVIDRFIGTPGRYYAQCSITRTSCKLLGVVDKEVRAE